MNNDLGEVMGNNYNKIVITTVVLNSVVVVVALASATIHGITFAPIGLLAFLTIVFATFIMMSRERSRNMDMLNDLNNKFEDCDQQLRRDRAFIVIFESLINNDEIDIKTKALRVSDFLVRIRARRDSNATLVALLSTFGMYALRNVYAESVFRGLQLIIAAMSEDATAEEIDALRERISATFSPNRSEKERWLLQIVDTLFPPADS